MNDRRPTAPSDAHRPSSAGLRDPRLWLGYLLTGAVLGGLWLWGSGDPAWEHALRTALFVVVVLPASYYGAQALRARRGRSPLPQISLLRIISAKLCLLLVALVVAAALDHVTSHADQIVAAGLLVVVAVAGPLCHHLLLPSRTSSSGATARPRGTAR